MAIGNHDDEEEELREKILEHYNLDPNGYYTHSFNVSDSQAGLILVMDTESPWGKGSEQYNFILHELESSQSFDHKIIISHKNFITCDCSHRPLPGLFDTYHDLFAKHDVDFVFSGHNHNYQRFSPIDNVTYIVTGLAGLLLMNSRTRTTNMKKDLTIRMVTLSSI